MNLERISESQAEAERSGLPAESGEVIDGLRRRALDWTSARVLVGRSGPAYRTATWLGLRQDHAAARDAVQDEVDLEILGGSGSTSVETEFLSLQSCATDKATYLRRPDLGRRLAAESRVLVQGHAICGVDLQIIVGDGLSAAAVMSQVPPLLALLLAGAHERRWSLGQLCFVRYCRVGILNDFGALVQPTVALLLIGERPGLATAESLSAYFAYQPSAEHTDAQRNLISNIHPRGIPTQEAAARILAFAALLMQHRCSGVSIKEGSSLLTGSGTAIPPL
jgi:ethanolamine ammonia-lyase small subunit